MPKETKNKSLHRKEFMDILELPRGEGNPRIPEEIEIVTVHENYGRTFTDIVVYGDAC
jgi:hypothetical protein